MHARGCRGSPRFFLAASFTDGERGEIFGSKCFGGRVRSFQGHPTHCGKRPCAAMGCAAAPGFKPAPQIAGAAMRPIAARGRSHTDRVLPPNHRIVGKRAPARSPPHQPIKRLIQPHIRIHQLLPPLLHPRLILLQPRLRLSQHAPHFFRLWPTGALAALHHRAGG